MKKPSVTELLQLLDKPALLGWANSQGLKGIDISKERSKWLNAGTSIHCQIERFIVDCIPFDDPKDQLKCEKFLDKYEVIDIETNIETDYFIGRYDLKAKSKETGKTYIIDFKRKCKKIYLEHKLQLVAYSMASECEGLMIVGVPDFKIFDIQIEDRTPYQEIMKSLSVIYQNKQKIEL